MRSGRVANRLAALLVPIDWGNPLASQIKKPQHPNKPKRRED